MTEIYPSRKKIPTTAAGILTGETLATVSGDAGVPAVTLEMWRADFLAGTVARLGGTAST